MKTKKMMFITLATLLILSFVITILYDKNLIPESFMTFIENAVVILLIAGSVIHVFSASEYFKKESIIKLIKQSAICFVQYLIFGGLTTVFDYLNMIGFIYPFAFLAAYSIFKMIAQLIVMEVCESEIKDNIKSISRENKGIKPQNDFSANAYALYVKYCISFVFKKTESMMIIIAPLAILSGCVYRINLPTLSNLLLGLALLIAIFSYILIFIAMDSNKRVDKIKHMCSHKYVNEIKMRVATQNK